MSQTSKSKSVLLVLERKETMKPRTLNLYENRIFRRHSWPCSPYFRVTMCLARNPQMGAATLGLDLPLRRSPDSCSSRSAPEGRHVLEGNDCSTAVAVYLLQPLLLIFGMPSEWTMKTLGFRTEMQCRNVTVQQRVLINKTAFECPLCIYPEYSFFYFSMHVPLL